MNPVSKRDELPPSGPSLDCADVASEFQRAEFAAVKRHRRIRVIGL
jgi:hypothetical protein